MGTLRWYYQQYLLPFLVFLSHPCIMSKFLFGVLANRMPTYYRFRWSFCRVGKNCIAPVLTHAFNSFLCLGFLRRFRIIFHAYFFYRIWKESEKNIILFEVFMLRASTILPSDQSSFERNCNI